MPNAADGTPLIRGRGAWDPLGHDTGSKYYKFTLLARQDGKRPTVDHHHLAVYHACIAIQARIKVDLGYPGTLTIGDGFGPRSRTAVAWFQERNTDPIGGKALKRDGEVGPATSRALVYPIIRDVCAYARIPARYLWGQSGHESLFDPGAVSTWWDPRKGQDEGYFQISKQHGFPPSMTFSPWPACVYSAGRFQNAMNDFDGKGPDLQLNCAIAQHNSPRAAREWFEVGSFPEDDPVFAYVQKIKARAEDYPE